MIAAALLIDDARFFEPLITFSLNDFEGGFTLDGNLVQQGLNNLQSVDVPEFRVGSLPIVYTFSADWITGAVVPGSGVIAFSEDGVSPTLGVSDILTFTYSSGPLGGHLVGTFESDGDPGFGRAGLLPLPDGATVVAETTAGFDFSNGNITANARSDIEAPEPASVALLGSALFGFGAFRRRRKKV